MTLRDVSYASGAVRYTSAFPVETIIKLSFVPKSVQVAGRPLRELASAQPAEKADGWSFNPATHVLTVQHSAGAISVTK